MIAVRKPVLLLGRASHECLQEPERPHDSRSGLSPRLGLHHAERQKAGIEKAKAEGVYKGRPVTLDYAKVKALHAQGVGPTAIAKQMGCSRGAVYKVLNQ